MSHVLLEPDQEATWPPGLPQEDDGNIAVTVENVRNIDMTLACRTTLGWLHSVDAIYPLETKGPFTPYPRPYPIRIGALSSGPGGRFIRQ